MGTEGDFPHPCGGRKSGEPGEEEALRLGHTDTLVKPFFVSALRTKIEELWNEEDNAPGPEAGEGCVLNGMRFLAAEDNAINAEILTELLDMEGASCEIAENGLLAVERFRCSEPGVETPGGANRWWLETFVFAIAYADLYNGGNTEAEIAALNSGEARYSDYMRPGFEFLQTLIDEGCVDAEKALVSEAIEAEGPDFRAGKTPVVMAYWGAANTETAYGKTDFEMQVIGFPSSRGQMPVMPMTGWGVGANAEHLEEAMKVINVITSDEALQLYSETNRVISPSRNVKVDCVPSPRPLNDRIEEGICVLGSNAGMSVEQWGNTCLIVRELLGGASVDECMAAFDELQNAALGK